MNERFCREGARSEAQKAGPVPGLVQLIQRPGKNFLLDPIGITCRYLPSAAEIERMELIVFFSDSHETEPVLGKIPGLSAKAAHSPDGATTLLPRLKSL